MYDSNALANFGVETGWVDAAIAEGAGLVNTFADIAAGGPQKRERAAKYARDAARAQTEAAALALEAAKVNAQAMQTAATSASSAPPPSSGGFIDRAIAVLKQPTPLFGLPVGVVVGGAAVAFWALR